MIAPDRHAAVVEALEANQWALFRSVADRGGAEVADDGEVLWAVTGVPVALFNGVLLTRLAPGRVDDAIAEVSATLDSRGVPWSWYVGPASVPHELPERLRAHGLALLEELPGMAASLEEEPPTALDGDLRFEEVRDEPRLDAVGTLLGLAFEMPTAVVEPFLRLLDVAGRGERPALRNFVALDHGEPVACGSLVLAAGVAGLYNIGVLPDHQGRGLGRAMTAALMAEGRARGARTATLWSSPAGLACYRGLGFEERCRMPIYARGLGS